ncbi:DUF4339 domain-containing protein [Flavisolibacter sp. BT320]|nr:DUF4339 domain-containing protein [Flavisolibacter longurius]
MVCYYLLRDNQEMGPYTLTELKGKTLFETDLIWVEGESTQWKIPTEITGLENITLAEKKQAIAKSKIHRKKLAEPQFPVIGSDSLSPAEGLDKSVYLPPDDYTPPSFDELKEKYAQKKPQKKVWKRQVNIGANLMGLLTLLIGLGLSAYMIKKAVENIDFEPTVASAQAVEISPETLPSSTATHAAFASFLPAAEKSVLIPDTTAVKTVTTAVVKEETAPLKPETKPKEAQGPAIEAKESAANNTALNTSSSNASTNATDVAGNTSAAEAKAEEESEKLKPAEEKTEAKLSLRLSANNYDVGFLGGISNLQISVSNPSSQEVSKALVEVEFLRKNGKVVGTQTVTVTGIAPGGSKTISIPDNNRGVSVRYKVVKTES